MRSRTTPNFRRLLARLPVHLQRQAVIAYRLFRENPFHPSLQFKRVSQSEPLYSVRVTQDYRAVGLWENDEIRWVWIGSHAATTRFCADDKKSDFSEKVGLLL